MSKLAGFLSHKIFYYGCRLLPFALAMGQSWAICAEPGGLSPARELSRFDRIVTQLQGEASESQTDFTIIALQQLSDAYEKEVALALSEVRDGDGNSKLLAWILSVEWYAKQLQIVQESLAAGSPAFLSWEHDAQLVIQAGGSIVILNHPRPGHQGLLEQSIVAEFCIRVECRDFVQNAEQGVVPMPMSRGSIRPDWKFTANGHICHYAGVSLYFDAEIVVSELQTAKVLCRQLMEELSGLAHELVWQKHQGVSIDWARLAVEALPGRTEYLVMLNVAGDSIIMSLPLTYANDGLLRRVQPWLQAQIEGEELEISLLFSDFERPPSRVN